MTRFETTTFTVLTANDIYEIQPTESGIGGLAELCTLINKEKKNLKDCIVTLNGDFLSASSLAVKLQGSHMIDILNTMPFDLISLGNHEFDFGAEVLIKRLGEVKKESKILNSNILKKGTKDIMDKTEELHVMELSNGTKVGFFAVCTQRTPELSKPGDSIVFEDVIECSKRMIKKLKDLKCEIFIALTHLDVAADRQLAVAVPEIQIILGGHDHSPHIQYQGETFLLKSGQNGQFLSNIEFTVEKKTIEFGGKEYSKLSIYPNLKLILNKGFEPNEKTKERVQYYVEQIPKDHSEPICVVMKFLNSKTENVRTKETNMASLYADAMKWTYEADIGFVSGGSVRADSGYYPGSYFTKGNLEKEAPFPNKCKVIEVTGEQFLKAVEYGISKLGAPVGSFPHFSHGINIEYDQEQPVGKRIIKALYNGKPLDVNQKFTIASTAFLLEGGDGYSIFKEGKEVEHKNNGKIIKDVVGDFMKHLKVIEYDDYDFRLYQKGQFNMWKVIYDKMKK